MTNGLIIYLSLNFMAKENTTTAASSTPNPMGMFGDMSLLRDIIMGPKVVEYDERLNAIEALIEKNNEATQAHFAALERDMNARFDRLEQLLMQNVEKLSNQIQHTSKTDKAMLADLLIGVSQKLKD
jgi:TfoX/Sxy family transcriptional regulator of competence genes